MANQEIPQPIAMAAINDGAMSTEERRLSAVNNTDKGNSQHASAPNSRILHHLMFRGRRATERAGNTLGKMASS
jgi:hypothetical protein